MVGMGSAAATNAGIVSDDFNTTTINSSTWTFLNPAGTATGSDNGTEAVITVPSGASQYASTTEEAPALVQTVGNGDFSAEVKFDSEVVQADQEQGLIAIQDPSDFIRFAIESIGTQAYVSAQATIGGVITTESQLAVRNGTNFYLRVARSGNTWSYSYSYNGQAWTSEGSFALTLTLTQVGPYAASGTAGSASAPGFTALVDYFHNIATATYTALPTITLWYGSNETFGQEGEPQAFVNVLGNVSDPAGMASLAYTLNGGASSALEMGENDYRLSSPGDFNAEIPYASLNVGANTVVITATDLAGNISTQTVTVNDDYTCQSWPGNYSVNWSSAPSINSVAQVVDGDWAIQGPNVRTLQTGYDRLIDIGDMNNWSQYQVTVPVTINALPLGGDNFGVGPIFGWQGHTNYGDGQQPADGHPFDAWFNYANNGPGDGDSLNIYANSPNHHEQVLASDTSGMQLTVGTTYDFEMQATTNAGGTTSQYSFKVWQAGTTEPANWLVQANGDLNQGSLLLASYWADVSYGPVTVTSLATPTPPVPAGTALGAWKVVQSSYTTASSPTTSQTACANLPQGTTAGDDVVVVLAGDTSGAAPTLTPAGGLVALAGYPGPTEPATFNPFAEVFVADDVPAGETSFAVTVTNGPSFGQSETALAVELSGPAIALDRSAILTGSGTSTTSLSQTLTPSTSNEMALSVAAWDANPTSATGPGGAVAAPDLSAPLPVASWFQSLADGSPTTSSVNWAWPADLPDPADEYDTTFAFFALATDSGGGGGTGGGVGGGGGTGGGGGGTPPVVPTTTTVPTTTSTTTTVAATTTTVATTAPAAPRTTTTVPRRVSPDVWALTRKALVSGHTVQLELRCTEAACRGNLSLRYGRTTLGAGRYNLALDETGWFSIKLIEKTSQLLADAKHHTIKVSEIVTVTAGKTVKKPLSLVR